MNKAKAFAWCPFRRDEDAAEVLARESTWGAVLQQGHLIIADDLAAWRRLRATNDVTLYILGHGNVNDANISSQNGTSRTPEQIYAALERNTGYMANGIRKIKVFTCHGGKESGPAHELKKLLVGSYARIRVFGYTDVTWDPNYPKVGDPAHRKYAGGSPQQYDQRQRASNLRFEVEPNYGDVGIHIGNIQLNVQEPAREKGWCACG